MRTAPVYLLLVSASLGLLWTGPAVASPRGVQILRCIDGEPHSLQISGQADGAMSGLTCDTDGSANGSCTFAAPCPLCSLSDPPCRIACAAGPAFDWSATPAGRIVRQSVDGHLLIFRCVSHRSHPARPTHPSRSH